MIKKQVGWRERVSYGLSDTASNLIFQMITIYLMFFYTDVFGISASTVATLFLVTRILDAFVDPLMGIIIDKTNSKWGKSRPYFLWLGVPFAIIAIMTFYTPDFGSTGKVVYAYITYALLGIIYSGINIPITSILPSMTSNPQERTELASIRMMLAFIGMLIVSVGTLPIVKLLGGGDQQKGFFLTMVLFGVIGGILFINTFVNVKERVVSSHDKPLPFRESMKAIKGNVPWLLLLISGFIQMSIMTMQMQTTVYFWTYNMNRPDLITVMMSLSVVSLLTLGISSLVAKRIGKRNTMITGSSIMIVGYTFAIFGSNNQSIPLILTGMVITSLGQGLSMSMGFAMIADAVDYGEWKSGVRAQGLLSAAVSFGAKVGMGVGGALSAAMLSLGKYVPGAEHQAHSALVAINMNYLWAPLVSAIIGIIIMLFYKLDRQIGAISEELDMQRIQV